MLQRVRSENVSHLLGAAASTEKVLTVFPAAPKRRLEAGAGVVADQVLLQMRHHPKHQRAAVPLPTQSKLISEQLLLGETHTGGVKRHKPVGL